MTLTQIKKAGLDELALDHVFTIGASGYSYYQFQGEGLNGTVNNPTLYLTRGKTYRFENTTGSHAIRIQSADNGTSGTLYNTGVTNNNTTGTVIVEVQHDAPDVLYYQCANHSNMKGTLYITGALADGGVTTAKLADDAVTDAKLANSINTAIAANTAKVQTTINNNADNRVITGSGTANTLEAESTLTWNGTLLDINQSGNTETGLKLRNSEGGLFVRANDDKTFIDTDQVVIRNEAETERARIDTSGNCGIGINSPTARLDVRRSDTDGKIAEFHQSTGYGIEIGSSQSEAYIASGHAQTFVFKSNPGSGITERMSIANNGRITQKTGSLIIDQSNNGYGGLRIHDNTAGNYSVDYILGRNSGLSAHVFKYNGRTQNQSPWADNGTGTEMGRWSAAGLSFNGDTAAANCLNDYEEGTFTPSISSGYSYANTITYSNQAGFYTKIGNQVFAYIYLQPSGNSAHSGNIMEDANRVQIDGLPFTSSNTSRQEGGGYITYTNGFFDTSGTANENLYAVPWVPQNVSYVIFHNRYSGGQIRGNNTNPNGLYLIFQVRYIAA